jgi:hypothetical protein
MAKFSIGLAICAVAFSLVVGLTDPTISGSGRTMGGTSLSP